MPWTKAGATNELGTVTMSLPSAPGTRSDRRFKRPTTLADLLTQYALPALATGLLIFAAWYVWGQRVVANSTAPPIAPAQSPFAATLAASGIVEAQTENISVGSPTPGIVTKVLVTVGDMVEAGTPLFQLDDRELLSDLAVKRAALTEAKNELVRLEAQPRPEEVPIRQAAVDEAQASVDLTSDALRRAEDTFARKVSTEQDLIERRKAHLMAQAQFARAHADLTLLEAGTWTYDLDVARADVAKADADVKKTETSIDRLVVRALVAGEVLQVNVRPGEFVGTPPGQPLIVLGDVDQLHVRVDIDEFDISRFRSESTASAVPRGSLQERYPLEFVRVEPYVVPKKSLTGDNTERVDTRVLQVIYNCDPRGRPSLYVGQQMEVFIDAAMPAEQGTGDEVNAGGGT
jgi:HlyD family secretion protein